MALPGFLKPEMGGIRLILRLQPRASKNEVVPGATDELKVRVTAPPVDSAANEALLDLLADKLNCPRNALQIVRGRTSRHKQVLIRGVMAEDILNKLGCE